MRSRFSRYFTAFLLAGAAGVTTSFVMALILAYLNLYLSGHNISWQEQPYTFGPFTLTCLDLAMLTVSSLAFSYTLYSELRKEPAQ